MRDGKLWSGERRIAIDALGSIQCFAAACQWSQTALEMVSNQCPTILARWDRAIRKWRTFALTPQARYVNPTAQWRLCRLSPARSTHLASALLWAKICNQHELLRCFDPRLPDRPHLKENSFNRILRLEAWYSRFFWPRYFSAFEQDLFQRERRKASNPLNAALNYGYGFLYHALEWQCLACGLDPGVGLIHRLRRSRPSLACDLIEPLRCCVELTVVRFWDDMLDTKMMAGRFAEMLETKFRYRGGSFRLRSVIRLMVESFVRALAGGQLEPFSLHARDAGV